MTLKPGEIIPLTFDYVFTSIFNNPDNIDILENFLSCYLEISLDELRGNLTLNSRELLLENKKNKNMQIDLLLDLKGEKINIELSNYSSKGVVDRNIVYACSIHSRQLKYGENSYSKIKKTIQINLNNYSTNEKLKETFYLKNKDGKILSHKFQIDNVDMVLGTKLCYTDSENKLARWCRVFTSKTKEEFMAAIGGNLMEEVVKEKLVDEVDKYSSDDQVIALYSKFTKEELERNTFIDEALEEGIKQGLREGLEKGMKQGIEEGLKQGIEEGLKQGIEEGINQSKIEIAKNLLKQNVSIDIIKISTGLNEKELNELI